MEASPLFSIVTVCKNCREKLFITANSVRNQRFTGYEYIIKDGESSDGTYEMAASLNACAVISGEDSGIFNAMNIALDYCRGEYVLFLNAGDVFCDEDVLTYVAAQISSRGSADFFYGDVISYASKRRYIIYPDRITRFFLYSDSICHQSWFLRRSAYIRLGKFDETTAIGADYLLMLRAILQAKLSYYHIRHFVAVYEGGGISANPVLVQQSEEARRKVRAESFGPLERKLFELLVQIRIFIKPLLYDTLLYRVFRRYGRSFYDQQQSRPL